MGKTLENKLQDLSPERCRRVDEQAAALIAEESGQIILACKKNIRRAFEAEVF